MFANYVPYKRDTWPYEEGFINTPTEKEMGLDFNEVPLKSFQVLKVNFD